MELKSSYPNRDESDMIYDLGYWRVPITSRGKHREIIRAIYSNIRSKHEKFATLESSRLYIMKSEIDGFETWLHVDAFADEEGYTQNAKALVEDVRAVTLRKEWKSLIVPGSFKTEIWTEFAPDLWI